MTDLKSTLPEDPTGLLRTCYKYAHPRAPVHILATFTKPYDEINDRDLESIAEWSMYQDDDTIIIEGQTSPISDFHKMVENWERVSNYEVICK